MYFNDYLIPTGMFPPQTQTISAQQKDNNQTNPINKTQNFSSHETEEWINLKKEQAEIELQEAEKFFTALKKITGKIQEAYEQSNKDSRMEALEKTKKVLADKWDYYFNDQYKNDTQEKDCFYNKKLSKDTALISRDVYNDEQKEINGYKPVDKLEDPETGLRVVAYQKKNDIIIAYCGTNDEKDFVSDAQMAMNEVPEQYEKANQFYLDTVTKNPNASVILTGHSLGGSLAQLVASRHRETSAVTFNAFGIKSILKNPETKAKDYFQDNKNSFNYIVMGDPVSNSTQHVGTTTRMQKTALNNHSIANYINLWA